MTIRDSLGVPLEPDYDEPILKDVYGDDVYKNDTVYLNFEGIVLEKNLERYSKEYVDELTAGEANEELREVMLPSEYSEVVKEAMLTWIVNNGYAKFFDLQPKRGEELIDASTL